MFFVLMFEKNLWHIFISKIYSDLGMYVGNENYSCICSAYEDVWCGVEEGDAIFINNANLMRGKMILKNYTFKLVIMILIN